MNQATLGSQAQIRMATGTELSACRTLLPEVLSWGVAPDFLIALSRSPLRFQGAAAFAVGRRRTDGRPLLKVAARVAKSFRGQGIGTGLLESLEAAASRRAIGLLASTVIRGRHDDWADFLSRNGFVSVERLHTFEADIENASGYYLSCRDWLVRRGQVSSEHSIISLREASPRELARLFAGNLDARNEGWETMINLKVDGGAENFGFALVGGGVIQAALLHRIDGPVVTIEAIVVAPSFRSEGTRVDASNILLSATAMDYYLSSGIKRIRAVVSASNSKAMKQYLRFKPDEIEVRETFERTIEPSSFATR